MNITLEPLNLTLYKPFVISHSTIQHLRNLLIIIRVDRITAFGEIIPIEFFGHSTEKAVIECQKIIDNYLNVMRKIEAVQEIQDFIQLLSKKKYPNYIIYGFEMALMDLLGKVKKKFVSELLCLEHKKKVESVETFPITNNDPYEWIKTVRSRTIKIKLGGPYDLNVLRAIRQFPEKLFILDINQGWRPNQIHEYSDMLESENILVIEEPFQEEYNFQLPILKEAAKGKAILLDESVKNANDIWKYKHLIDGIDIKLSKFGGIFKSLQVIESMKPEGILFMLGCFLESKLSIAYACHVSSLFNWVDLDGSSYISNDPFNGLEFENGIIRLESNSYGIGVNY